MAIVAVLIGSFILGSAALVIVLCMFSSRLSAQEGRQEDWSNVPVKAERRPYVPGGVTR